jgi:uncharacterized protein (TIGR03435 family)
MSSIPDSCSGTSAFTALGLLVVAAPVLFGLAIVAQSSAQSQDQNSAAIATEFEYDVASIKPSKPGNAGGSYMLSPDGFTARNMALGDLIQVAYGAQISGASAWVNSEKFDVDAKMEESVADELKKLTQEQNILVRQKMLQALLADRFKLVIHHETKEVAVYILIAAKKGSKLHEAKLGDTYSSIAKPPNGLPLEAGNTRMAGRGGFHKLTAHAIPVAELAHILSAYLGRQVVDRTGLTEKYDFVLDWGPDDRPLRTTPGDEPGGLSVPAGTDHDSPPLPEAIQQQLGLKLESGKGPVEIIVIDHVERPSGN